MKRVLQKLDFEVFVNDMHSEIITSPLSRLMVIPEKAFYKKASPIRWPLCANSWALFGM